MLDAYFPLFWKYLRNCVKAGVKQMPLLNLAHIDEKNKITGGRKGGCVSIRWPLFESGRVPYELCKQSRCLLQNPFKQVGNRLSELSCVSGNYGGRKDTTFAGILIGQTLPNPQLQSAAWGLTNSSVSIPVSTESQSEHLARSQAPSWLPWPASPLPASLLSLSPLQWLTPAGVPG